MGTYLWGGMILIFLKKNGDGDCDDVDDNDVENETENMLMQIFLTQKT